MVKRGRLKVQHLAGTEQIADALTKQLSIEKFQQFRREIGWLNFLKKGDVGTINVTVLTTRLSA